MPFAPITAVVFERVKGIVPLGVPSYKVNVLRAVGLIAGIVIALSALAWGTLLAVNRITQGWFEKDLQLRCELAVSGARRALLAGWQDADVSKVRDALDMVAHDERIMAAAACQADGTTLAVTNDYPFELQCEPLVKQLGPRAIDSHDRPRTAGMYANRPRGRVHVSAVPLVQNDEVRGFVLLVHDISFIDSREASLHRPILVAFAVIAAIASMATFAAGRLLRWWWTRDVLAFLRRGGSSREFRPILADLRALLERMSTERNSAAESGPWTPDRLRRVLVQHLRGEQVVLLANREPYIHNLTTSGAVEIVHPASGLVTAMEPVMRACGGVWVAHGSGSADRTSADIHGRIRVPPGEESYTLRRVWLTSEEEQGYYYGFSNEGLWPLCHIAHARPLFRREDWEMYREVNQRFSDTVCGEVDSDDPIILCQDYHFALAPRMIREQLPRATVLSFWHIPWPNAERMSICPWTAELVEGMLGSSIMGFHTQAHCNNFLDAVDRFLEARIDRERNGVVQNKRQTLVRPYPISIEWPSHWAQSIPDAATCRADTFAELGLGPDMLLGVGVDRLDYTKGVEERLWAVQRLLERFPEYRERFTFVQLAAPSRAVIPRYRELNESVEAVAAGINERFGTPSYRPVILLRAHHEPPTVYRYYRAAHLCYVSSLHDGMNLVAKEFIAARDDEQGVLVLSLFAGAAKELTEALIVNPYDLDEASSAMVAALTMPQREQKLRMQAMRSLLTDFNVYRWAGHMLVDAAQLRRKERLSGRLTPHSP